jgi:hypothetical protein
LTLETLFSGKFGIYQKGAVDFQAIAILECFCGMNRAAPNAVASLLMQSEFKSLQMSLKFWV